MHEIGIIASRFNGENAVSSNIFTLATGTKTTLQITIPPDFRLYLLRSGGYVTQSDISVEFKNRQGQIQYSWSEFPDTQTEFNNYVFLAESYEGNIKFTFNNTSGSTTTISWFINGILIPKSSTTNFEIDIKKLVEKDKVLVTKTAENQVILNKVKQFSEEEIDCR